MLRYPNNGKGLQDFAFMVAELQQSGATFKVGRDNGEYWIEIK